MPRIDFRKNEIRVELTSYSLETLIVLRYFSKENCFEKFINVGDVRSSLFGKKRRKIVRCRRFLKSSRLPDFSLLSF